MLNLIGDLQELNISYESSNNYDIESYQEELYLAGLNFNHNPENQPYLKILIYDNFREVWEELYEKKIEVFIDTNNYQVKFLKLNNLYHKKNLFLVIASEDSNYIFRLEDDNFFVEIKNNVIINTLLNRIYINADQGIYLLDENQEENQLKINFKYWSDWSQEKEKNITISENLIDQKSKISQIALYKNKIYLGKNNLQKGIEIYKLDWDKNNINNLICQEIIIKGAYRYSLNQKIFAMTVFQDCLYFACGLDLENKTLKEFSTYKNGFELIRIYEDNDWDIIAGSPKFSPQGLKVPLSTFDGGFDDNNNIIVDSLLVHQNQLYLWTKNIDNCQIWHSDHGEDWEQNILNLELNNYAEIKVIKTLSSSLGLITLMELDNLDKTKSVVIFCGY